MKAELRDKVLVIPIILLFVYLLFRLVDTSAMINNFPFDYANDLSAHLAKLFFLNEYGVHEVVPYWYNGFNYNLFQSYPPGYYYAALPLYKILGNVQLATYVFLLLIYIFGFVAVYFLMRDISKIKRIALYLFFFANPIAIGYLLRLGKLPEITGWLLNLIIFGILIYYKDRPLDRRFLFFIPVYSASLLSNVSSFIVMSPLIFGFFLMKSKKEKIYIALSAVATLIITSFWWIPFYLSSFKSSLGSEAKYTYWLIENAPNTFFTFTMDKLTTFVTSSLLIILFYFYIRNKPKKELLLFLPIVIEAFLILTKIIVYFPVYNRPPPDTFNIGFILIASYFFLTTDYPERIRKMMSSSLGIVSFSVIILLITFTSLEITPTYPRLGSIERETIGLLPFVEGNFIVLEDNVGTYGSSYSRAYYSYAPIYYNITTISGWIDQMLLEKDAEQINKLLNGYTEMSSEEILERARNLHVGSIILYDEDCARMEEASLIVKKTEHVCLIYT